MRPFDKSISDRVDALFAQYDRTDSPGCALGIVLNGQMVYSRGYGQAKLEHGAAGLATSTAAC